MHRVCGSEWHDKFERSEEVWKALVIITSLQAEILTSDPLNMKHELNQQTDFCQQILPYTFSKHDSTGLIK